MTSPWLVPFAGFAVIFWLLVRALGLAG